MEESLASYDGKRGVASEPGVAAMFARKTIRKAAGAGGIGVRLKARRALSIAEEDSEEYEQQQHEGYDDSGGDDDVRQDRPPPPAGNASVAVKALKKMEQMEAAAVVMEEERLLRRANMANDLLGPNLQQEALQNYRKDKVIVTQAVERRLKADKEKAERAKFEPPLEFILKMANKAMEEAKIKARAKGANNRDAVAAGAKVSGKECVLEWR